MKFRKFFIIPALLVCLVACDANRLRQCANTSDRMAVSISSAIDIKRELKKAALIDDGEDMAITSCLLKLNLAVKEFNTRAKTYDADTPVNRAELSKLFADVTGGLRELEEKGVVPVKNPDARQKMSAVLKTLEASAQIIQSLLQ